MNKNKGFNLIELMIVVAIIGILVTAAVPMFGNIIQRNRLKTAVQSFQDDMQFARTNAIKKNRDVVMSVVAGDAGAWCYGLSTSPNACDCTQPLTATNCDIKIVSGTGFSTTNVTTAGSITFSSRRGSATPSVAAANRITFTSTDFAAAVSTDIDGSGNTTPDAGRVISCNPAVSGKSGLPKMPNC